MENSERDGNTRPPASWETYMQVRKQQLELYMASQNGQYQPLLGANAADDFQLKNAQTTAQLHPSHTLVK